MKTAALILVLSSLSLLATPPALPLIPKPLDEVFQDGRQVRATIEGAKAKLLGDFGGSSSYGLNSLRISRGYKIGNVTPAQEVAFLTNLGKALEKTINDRAWRNDAFVRPTPLDEARTAYSCQLRFSAENQFGTFELKAVRVSDGLMIFIDLLQQERMGPLK